MRWPLESRIVTAFPLPDGVGEKHLITATREAHSCFAPHLNLPQATT